MGMWTMFFAKAMQFSAGGSSSNGSMSEVQGSYDARKA
jgi:hypothetical protein